MTIGPLVNHVNHIKRFVLVDTEYQGLAGKDFVINFTLRVHHVECSHLDQFCLRVNCKCDLSFSRGIGDNRSGQKSLKRFCIYPSELSVIETYLFDLNFERSWRLIFITREVKSPGN